MDASCVMRHNERMSTQGYISITGAARKYGVSRAKVARLIEKESLPTERDPRDARARVVREADIARLLGVPVEYGQGAPAAGEVRDRGALAVADRYIAGTGRLTARQRAQVDALRARFARGRGGEDSVDVIRRERDRRARALDGGAKQS